MKKKTKIFDMFYDHTTDDQPDTVWDMVNFYGTYEIQKTADTFNPYPAIAQGFNEKQAKTDRQNPHGDAKKW